MKIKQNRLITLCQQLMDSLAGTDNLDNPQTADRALDAFEALGRHLEIAEHLVEPGLQVKQNLLAAIRRDDIYPGFVSRLMSLFDLSVSEIKAVLSQMPSDEDHPVEPWRESGVDGVYLLHFNGGPRVTGLDCGLIYMTPGATFPNHRHKGQELALILQGRVLENARQLYRPGDRILQAPGSQHTFSASGDEVAVIAVVVEKGISFVPSDSIYEE